MFPAERPRKADTPLGPATVFACTHEHRAQSLENGVCLAMAGCLSMAMCHVIKAEPGLIQPESPNAALTEAGAQALGVPFGREVTSFAKAVARVLLSVCPAQDSLVAKAYADAAALIPQTDAPMAAYVLTITLLTSLQDELGTRRTELGLGASRYAQLRLAAFRWMATLEPFYTALNVRPTGQQAAIIGFDCPAGQWEFKPLADILGLHDQKARPRKEKKERGLAPVKGSSSPSVNKATQGSISCMHSSWVRRQVAWSSSESAGSEKRWPQW